MTADGATDEIILVSSDGTEFSFPMSHAMMSGMFEYWSGVLVEYWSVLVERKYIKDSRVSVGISTDILGYVCDYFKYKEQCQRFPDELIRFHIPCNVARDLMLASTFLDC